MFILIFLFVPDTSRYTLEELDYIFAVPTRRFINYQVRTVGSPAKPRAFQLLTKSRCSHGSLDDICFSNVVNRSSHCTILSAATSRLPPHRIRQKLLSSTYQPRLTESFIRPSETTLTKNVYHEVGDTAILARGRLNWAKVMVMMPST